MYHFIVVVVEVMHCIITTVFDCMTWTDEMLPELGCHQVLAYLFYIVTIDVHCLSRIFSFTDKLID